MAVIAIVAAGVGLVLGTLTPSTAALAQSPAPARVAPSVAFHYGARPPVDMLQAFDVACLLYTSDAADE